MREVLLSWPHRGCTQFEGECRVWLVCTLDRALRVDPAIAEEVREREIHFTDVPGEFGRRRRRAALRTREHTFHHRAWLSERITEFL